MSAIVSMLLVFVAAICASFFWRIKRDDFLASESDRCLNKFCEAGEDWDSRGRMYTRGLAVIEESGKKQFVKQAKLVDIGILE